MDRTSQNRQFPTTKWSLIMKIRDGGEEEVSVAMEQVCRDYWSPLYSYLRLIGDSPEQAEDHVQGFFLQMLSSEGFKNVASPSESDGEDATPENGRLRSFLLTCLKNYRAKSYRASTAEKRGGTESPVAIDAEMAERQLADLSGSGVDPEKAYDKAWALNLIRCATEEVEQSYQKRNQGELFTTLEPLLGWNQSSDEGTQAEIASRLGVSESSIKVGLHRLRKRVREAIKLEIERTIDSSFGVTVDEELGALFSILS